MNPVRTVTVLAATTDNRAGLEDASADMGAVVIRGNTLLARFDSATEAVSAAIERVEGAPAVLQVGLSAGELTIQDDDWSGMASTEALALARAARPGEILVADVVHALARRSSGFRFESVVDVVVAGLNDPVAAWRVIPVPDETVRRQLKDGELRVVIAEDHPVMRGGLRSLLEAHDIRVVAEAADGAEAVACARRLKPDLVLMDLQMPGTDGLTATEELLSHDPQAIVLILTMYADDESVFSALRAGARGYVVKGAAPEDLVAAIRAVARGQVIFDAALAERIVSELQRPRPAEAFAELTVREREVFELLARGLNNRMIAQRLGVSPKTVANHVSNVFAKLHLADRAQAIVRARDAGLGRS